MKKICKQGISLLLAVTLLLSLSVSAMAAGTDLKTAIEGSAAYMMKTVRHPQVGSVGGEWAVIGLARSGYQVPQTYWDTYYQTVTSYVSEKQGVLHQKKYTEYSRLIVALTAIGANPADVAGYNLLTPLGDFDKTVWQGVNGPIWALIALDSGKYDMPHNPDAKTQATRQMYVDEILNRQLEDGGWNLTDRGGRASADPDVTGMALQALSGYREQDAVQTAIDRALSYLSTVQKSDGGYASYGINNSESVVQVIVALGALQIDLNDARFVKQGHTLLDNLLSFRQADGSFVHTGSGSGDSQMSSEQGLYGMVAAQRAAQGKSSLYTMNDVTIHVSGMGANTTGSDAVGLPGKDPAIQPVPVTAPGTTFSDISGHANQTAIEALASRKMINGKGDDRFDPNATMTRAEFATIMVQTLGLSPKTTSAFTDVAANQWYAPYIGTAHSYGLINGKGEGVFDADGTITRQEAAAMVTRAAARCGMETKLQDHEVLNTLAQFSDYVTVEQWARASVAFCYKTDILNQQDLNVQPNRAILRCEIAQMLYNLLKQAKLL